MLPHLCACANVHCLSSTDRCSPYEPYVGCVSHLEAQQVGIVLVNLQLLVVEQLDGLIVEQHIHSFACGQVVQLIHLLAHLCGSLQPTPELAMTNVSCITHDSVYNMYQM